MTKGWDNKRLAWGGCVLLLLFSLEILRWPQYLVLRSRAHTRRGEEAVCSLDFDHYFHSFLLCHCCGNLYAIVNEACVTDHPTCHPHLLFCSLLFMSLRWKTTRTAESLSCWPPFKIISFFLIDKLLFILPCPGLCFAFIVYFVKRVRVTRCSH